MSRKTTVPSSKHLAKPISDSEFFKSLPDDAFFCSDTVQHVYMYGVVSDRSLEKLRADIVTACKSTIDAHGNTLAPRPIVLHVNSPGGDADAGLSMMSVFNECRVPICACVDGISYSAGTLISIMAPYRVMVPMATSLVHDYSTTTSGKAADIQFDLEAGSAFTATISKVYRQRTRIPATQLDELLQRDMVLSAQQCLRMGICDRVLSSVPDTASSAGDKSSRPRGATSTNTSTSTSMSMSMRARARVNSSNSVSPGASILALMRKSNLNHVRAPDSMDTFEEECDMALEFVQQFDNMLLAGSSGMLRPVVIHATTLGCLTRMDNQVSPVAARIGALGRVTETFGVVDTHITLVNMIPILLCRRRLMYDHARVIVHLMYTKDGSWMLRDVIHNTDIILESIRQVLRKFTRCPDTLIADLDKRRFILTAHECLEYGMVDEVASVGGGSVRL